IRRARQIIHRIKPECSLEVDGGVDATTAPLAVGAGADVLVAGSAISMTAKISPKRWNGCGPQSGSNAERRHECGRQITRHILRKPKQCLFVAALTGVSQPEVIA